jgi:hypothetical protein
MFFSVFFIAGPLLPRKKGIQSLTLSSPFKREEKR